MEKRGKIWETEEEDRDTFAELKERAGMKAARLALHFVMITINCVARFHVDDSVYLFYSRRSAVYSYRCGLQDYIT